MLFLLRVKKALTLVRPSLSHNVSSEVEWHTLTFFSLSLFPALEPRILTRWDMHRYAREAYDLGVRYIGGCCGFEPYHIRAIAQEVTKLTLLLYHF